MNKVLKVAVLRGGNKFHDESLSSSIFVMSSLKKNDIEPIDIYIDRAGNWWNFGEMQNIHDVFSSVHGFVDTTLDISADYHNLAKKMGLPNLLSHHSYGVTLTRDDVYRVLRQTNITVPDSVVIRSFPSKEEIENKLKLSWRTFHTPIIVRANNRNIREKSFLVRSFNDMVSAVDYFLSKNEDAQILSFREKDIFSFSVLPSYRGEKFYTPIAVKSLHNKKEKPNKNTKVNVYMYLKDEEKNKIKNIINNVCHALSVSQNILIDIIPHKNDFMVVNVDHHPSLRKDGRFIKSLESTGTELGHYIKEKIKSF